MRPNEIEAWALRILESVARKEFVEDSTVELKAEWSDSDRAARQIAGHANAARGESILWLIGVDEKKGVVGATFHELSNWIQKVQSEFDGVAPSLQDVIVHCGEKNVVALCFDTSRAPFVV